MAWLRKKKKKNCRCLDETQKSCQKIWRPFSGNKRLKYCSKRVNFDWRYFGLVRRVPTKAAAPLIFLFFTSIYVSRLRKIFASFKNSWLIINWFFPFARRCSSVNKSFTNWQAPVLCQVYTQALFSRFLQTWSRRSFGWR